jgi:hypothetical protein
MRYNIMRALARESRAIGISSRTLDIQYHLNLKVVG